MHAHPCSKMPVITAPTAVAGRCKRPCGCVTVSSPVPHRDDGVNSELPEVPVETCPVLSMQGAVQGIFVCN